MPHQIVPKDWLSVTQVLSLTIDKPFLRYWFGKYGIDKCNQITRESQEIGTEVHRLIEERFKDNDYTAIEGSNELRMTKNFWKKFVIPFEVKPVELEVTIKDEKLKLQGTTDAVVDTNKGRFLMDWKTSSSIDKIGVPLQLSMYAYLYGKGIEHGGVVRIDKENDQVEIKWYKDLKQYDLIWKAALKLARWIKFGEV